LPGKYRTWVASNTDTPDGTPVFSQWFNSLDTKIKVNLVSGQPAEFSGDPSGDKG